MMSFIFNTVASVIICVFVPLIIYTALIWWNLKVWPGH